jgi:hypothetical protein|nr:MAG TPA: tail connector protein [Caudoviricetes sp.]
MLNELKLMLGIDSEDTTQDTKLNLLIDTATARLKILLGGMEPPESMAHIIREIAIVRFNKIGSEGLLSHNVEGESLSFNENDFSAFSSEIQAFLDAQETGSRGRVRFI